MSAVPGLPINARLVKAFEQAQAGVFAGSFRDRRHYPKLAECFCFVTRSWRSSTSNVDDGFFVGTCYDQQKFGTCPHAATKQYEPQLQTRSQRVSANQHQALLVESTILVWSGRGQRRLTLENRSNFTTWMIRELLMLETRWGGATLRLLVLDGSCSVATRKAEHRHNRDLYTLTVTMKSTAVSMGTTENPIQLMSIKKGSMNSRKL